MNELVGRKKNKFIEVLGNLDCIKLNKEAVANWTLGKKKRIVKIIENKTNLKVNNLKIFKYKIIILIKYYILCQLNWTILNPVYLVYSLILYCRGKGLTIEIKQPFKNSYLP